jgi:hypothetical protein
MYFFQGLDSLNSYRGSSSFMPHPTYKTLISYIEDQLLDDDRSRVEAHLSASCPHCSEKIARIRAALAAAAEDRTLAPPPEVLSRAVALYQKRPKPSLRPHLRVLAKLHFDSRFQMSALATRGAGRTRQMLFTTEQVDIDLQMIQEGENHNLVGQVLGSDEADKLSEAFVSLQSEDGGLIKGIETDALGQFVFKQIPSGVYDLVLDLGSQDVAITGLELTNDQ